MAAQRVDHAPYIVQAVL